MFVKNHILSIMVFMFLFGVWVGVTIVAQVALRKAETRKPDWLKQCRMRIDPWVNSLNNPQHINSWAFKTSNLKHQYEYQLYLYRAGRLWPGINGIKSGVETRASIQVASRGTYSHGGKQPMVSGERHPNSCLCSKTCSQKWLARPPASPLPKVRCSACPRPSISIGAWAPQSCSRSEGDTPLVPGETGLLLETPDGKTEIFGRFPPIENLL